MGELAELIPKKMVYAFTFLILVSNLPIIPEAISQDALEGKHVKVTFTEPVNITIVSRMQSLLLFLDEAHDFLLEWTKFTAYSGDIIEIKHNKYLCTHAKLRETRLKGAQLFSVYACINNLLLRK